MAKSKKRKARRNVSRGVAHIKSTFNNTIVTISDTNGDTAQQYFPRFDASNGAALDLSFAAPSAGSCTTPN